MDIRSRSTMVCFNNSGPLFSSLTSAEPFARNGSLTLTLEDGIDPNDIAEPKGSAENTSLTIGIKQIQMEQDTAKTAAQPPSTYLLDFNRVSHPLIEIITLPHIHSPATAAATVRKIQSLLRSVDSCVAGMEMGGLRADVNVSVRQRGSTGCRLWILVDEH